MLICPKCGYEIYGVGSVQRMQCPVCKSVIEFAPMQMKSDPKKDSWIILLCSFFGIMPAAFFFAVMLILALVFDADEEPILIVLLVLLGILTLASIIAAIAFYKKRNQK